MVGDAIAIIHAEKGIKIMPDLQINYEQKLKFPLKNLNQKKHQYQNTHISFLLNHHPLLFSFKRAFSLYVCRIESAILPGHRHTVNRHRTTGGYTPGTRGIRSFLESSIDDAVVV